ncbi:MAG: hypothetical protein ACRDXX_09030 [Stackebrandtia sp.]
MTTAMERQTGVGSVLPGRPDLVDTLRRGGRRVIGPTVHGGVELGDIESAADLLYGMGVYVEAGHYELRHRGNRLAFGCTPIRQSRNRFLHPRRQLPRSAELREDC